MSKQITLQLTFLFLLFLSSGCNIKASQQDIRHLENFNPDWKFFRGDVKDAQKNEFNDSAWRNLDLPHDWSIEDLPQKDGVKQIGPFSEESVGKAATGHTIGGTAWYRKHFTLNSSDKGKIVKILFDGIYMNSDVWINGRHLGNHPYGYTAFSYDMTSYLKPAGEDNVIAVQVKNEGKNSRWYSGSGIYRNVTLIKTNTVHIDLWGNYITTPGVSKEKAVIEIETKLVNKSNEKTSIIIGTSIIDKEGKVVGATESTTIVDTGNWTAIKQTINLIRPGLWSPGSPSLYTAVTVIKKNGKLIDQTETKFGIRSLDFSPEKGFLLNGESVKLKGACMHHDNGPLGAAAFKSAEYRRVRVMKENGFNAIRTSHNPPSEVFLEACDELGMLVMDESFDQWQKGKNDMDYHIYFDEWWAKDIESMVLRDRNHPSVIIWSIGNEISEYVSGVKLTTMLRDKIKEFDKTRPVTQAFVGFWTEPKVSWDESEKIFSLIDVQGYNYHWQSYEPDFKRFPYRILMGTESNPQEAFVNWEQVEKHPFVIGDFVWSGMDYLGESGLGYAVPDPVIKESDFELPWPWYNANCGDIDILGYKKPQMYFRDVVWKNSNIEMLVHAPIPRGHKEMISGWGWPNEWKSWNWEGSESDSLMVSVYSRADQIRLELNGKEAGTKSISDKTNLTAKFKVPYQPGELLAIAYKDGKETARQSLKTTGKPVAVKITPERDRITASGDELVYFNVVVVDKDGLAVPDAGVLIKFNIRGDCKLQGVANGKPDEMRSFQKPEVTSFRGRCQLIVRSGKKEGEIEVSARSEGLTTGTSSIQVIKMK